MAYTILRGDTISSVALRFGMTAKELAKYDGGTGVPNIMRLRSRNVHVVHPGEVILVPRR
jgi:LysM repeat protein